MKEIKPQYGPVRENEILLKDNDVWLHFAKPHRLVSVAALDEVRPALREIEQSVLDNGWYAAGFLSYEAAAAFDTALQIHASIPGADMRSARTAEFPYLWFGLYPQPRVVTLPGPERSTGVLNWQPQVEPGAYNAAIEQIKNHIAAGRTYQVNYTMRLKADFRGDAWDFFLRLVQRQNRHAAYVDTGRHVVCSASPELFFALDDDLITCRPMKGTAPRGRTTIEDQRRSRWLRDSEKNRAENVMIVDMIRNELGRIAETGSVCVPELFQTERYPTLWQMTSTVTARTMASIEELFAALFPCASITGAPKVSTMRIIAELESTPRKIYTGSIGYLAPQRKAKFNVAIRTLLIDRARQQAEYGVGGGIVWDSTSPDEYAEALLKARLLMEPETPFSLVETMLWTPEAGFFLREKHLARMMDSAAYFDIPVTRERLDTYFEEISSGFHSPHRVRVLLDQAGNLESSSSLHEIAGSSAALNVCLAREPVESGNVFLYHKTTQRAVYEAARAGCKEFDDVMLYNEWGELTEFTIGNLVVELEGQLLTPPISCGVLPGVFRTYLLETGQVREGTFLVEQLADCSKVFRVNSVRKWQEVAVHSEIKRLL